MRRRCHLNPEAYYDKQPMGVDSPYLNFTIPRMVGTAP